MKTTDYLYGIDPRIIKVIPYEEALLAKLRGANKVLLELLDTPLMTRDLKRIADVKEAIYHNDKLLKELNGEPIIPRVLKKDNDSNTHVTKGIANVN